MSSAGTVKLTHRVIAVVAGDEREQEIARLAALTGAEVRAFGFPWRDGGIAGVIRADSARAAVAGADYALFPIPGLAVDGSLFAPEHPEPIVPDADLLAPMRTGAVIVLGLADERLRACAAALDLRLREYEHDTELMLLRGPAIVEGALQVAIQHTDITLHAARIGIVGYGNVGRLLARTLVLLGAEVHLFARNRVQRADSYTAGCRAHELDELPAEAGSLDMIVNTVPVALVGEAVLRALPPSAFVMDLAAPPGGVDLAAARRLGLRAVWARGLGRRAPVTVGRSQWQGIERLITEIEEGR